MSIFKTAYETTATRGFTVGVNKTIESLQEALVMGQLKQSPYSPIACELIQEYGVTKTPPFAHPMLIKDTSEVKVLVSDMRPFAKRDIRTGEITVKPTNESLLANNRLALNAAWLTEDPQYLFNASFLPMVVFANWLSQTIARRLVLNPREQLDLAIFTAYYYISLFHDDEKFIQAEKTRIISQISKNLRCSAQDVLSVLDIVDDRPIPDLEAYAKLAREVVGSVRLEALTVPVIFQLHSGGWFGMNARETVAVALEHPPTWIALLYTAVTDRSFKQTMINQALESNAKTDVRGQFQKAIYGFIDSINE